METNQDYTISDFMGYGEITVPKGTKLTHKTALGIDKNYHFVSDLSWIKRDYPTVANILTHDATYYGINVPKEFVKY